MSTGLDTIENQNAIKTLADAIVSGSPRIVFFFGAGASVPSGIPGGNEVSRALKSSLKQLMKTHIFCQHLGSDLKKAQMDIANGHTTFERLVEIYQQGMGPDQVYSWIPCFIPKRLRESKPPILPSLTHEYCAHLVSNGTVQTIISMNFDELLEETLDDELGAGGFKTISSMSEFQMLEKAPREKWNEMFHHAPYSCFVLKPHGTISRPLTWRTQANQVQEFEQQKLSVLRTALEGALIVLLGFSMYNEDCCDLFHRSFGVGQTDNIIIVDTNPVQVEANLPSMSSRKILKYTGTISDYFFKTINNIYDIDPPDDARKEYRYLHQRPTRHIIRHKVFELFHHTSNTDPQVLGALEKVQPKHLEKCVYEMEMLIHLMKSRGLFIQLASVDCHRIEKAFRRCRELCANDPAAIASLDPFTVLTSILNRDKTKLVARAPVKDRTTLEALNTYWCQLLCVPNTGNDSWEGVRKNTFEQIASRFAKHVSMSFNKIGQYELISKTAEASLSTDLENEFTKLSHDFDIDITNLENTTYMRFQCPEVIRNRIEFEKITQSIIANSECNRFRVATVAGEWLGKHFEKMGPILRERGRLNIEIISNLDVLISHPGELGNQLTAQDKTRFLFHFVQLGESIGRLLNAIAENCENETELHWYGLRNLEHHLFVGSDGRTYPEKHLGATYFLRPGKNVSITPVSLSLKADLDALCTYFDSRKNVENETVNTETILKIQVLDRKLVPIDESAVSEQMKELLQIALKSNSSDTLGGILKAI